MTNEEAINTLKSLKDYYNDKNEDSYVGFDDEDNEALDLAIKALEQRWIPISERLPELGEVVLIYDKAFGYLTAIYSEVVDDYDERIPCFSTHYSISSDKRAIMHPIAWMPLPDMYEEDAE